MTEHSVDVELIEASLTAMDLVVNLQEVKGLCPTCFYMTMIISLAATLVKYHDCEPDMILDGLVSVLDAVSPMLDNAGGTLH